MAEALIDLSVAAPVEPPPPVPYRAVLGALSLILLAVLAGSAPRAHPQPPVIIPARLGDATFLDGDRLFVVGTGRLETYMNRVVTGYRLPAAAPLGRTAVTVAGAVVGVEQAGDVVVVAYQYSTSGNTGVVAQVVGASTPAWRRNARLIGTSAADRTALLADESGVIAVDVRTGALRWRVPRPPDGFIAPAGEGFPRWLVLTTDSGRLETFDPHTGRRLAAATLPALPGRANGLIWPINDLVLADTGRGFDGYRLPGLERLWHTAVDLSQSWMEADCARIICTFRQQRGMTALDPATGRELWQSPRWAWAEPFGPYLLGSAGEDHVTWVIDPADGEPLGNFGDWRGLGVAGGRLYGIRDNRYYGMLDPATREVDYLGTAPRVSGDCEVGSGVLICRLVDASVAVWQLE
jgi:outer membrane protein assembly factor BamB